MLSYLVTHRLDLFLHTCSTYRYGHTNSGFDILLESVIGQFYKESDIEEVNMFFNNKDDLGSVERGVKKGNLPVNSSNYFDQVLKVYSKSTMIDLLLL